MRGMMRRGQVYVVITRKGRLAREENQGTYDFSGDTYLIRIHPISAGIGPRNRCSILVEKTRVAIATMRGGKPCDYSH